jgi:flagellin
MGLRVNTNVQSLAAQRFLGLNKSAQDRSIERLSSGNRINRSGDDAAGLAISENLRGQIRSLKQAQRNANDGVSLIQVAEGSMNEVGNILIRLRELSIQGASDTIGDLERSYIDKEVQGIKAEIDRIAMGTEFNGHKLLDGSSDKLEIQVGMRNDPFMDRLVFDTTNLNTSASVLGVSNVSTMTKEESQANLDAIDGAITRVAANRSDLGALQNRLGSTINNLGIFTENLSTANSRIRETDVAEESSELTKNNILVNSTISMLAQANITPQSALKLLS